MRAFLLSPTDFQLDPTGTAEVPEGATVLEAPDDVPPLDIVYDGKKLIRREHVSTWYVDPATGNLTAFRGAPDWLEDIPPTAAEELADLKQRMKDEIDREAEQRRLRFITAGDGQSMEYMDTAAEADRLASDPNPNPSPDDYPMLTAAVGVDGPDIASVAKVVRERREAWKTIGAAIRSVRLSTKQAIDRARTEKSVRALRAGVVWPD